jgi:hypothetical protein
MLGQMAPAAQEPVPVQSVLRALRLHPRVAYQGFFPGDDEKARLLANVPALVPFHQSYHAGIAIVDWDHRLPSKQLTLRLYLFYDEWTFAEGEHAFDQRLEEIGQRDRFPEFDVPDFGELPADEVYEAEIATTGEVAQCRLTSPWRREVAPAEGMAAVLVARASAEFEKIAAAALDRPRHLGDLEAVSWTPPCESGHARWTLDVWYLLAFDGRVGSGRSLLVDLADKQVIRVRDFSVRAG